MKSEPPALAGVAELCADWCRSWREVSDTPRPALVSSNTDEQQVKEDQTEV